MNQELINYIRQCRQKGMTDGEIMVNLSGVGWQISQIKAGLSFDRGEKVLVPDVNSNLIYDKMKVDAEKVPLFSKKSKKRLFIISGIILFLIFAAFLYLKISNKQIDINAFSRAITGEENTGSEDSETTPGDNKPKTEHDLLIEAEKKREEATQNGQYDTVWGLMHPDFQKAYWGNNKKDYIDFMEKHDELNLKKLNYTIKSQEIVKEEAGLSEDNAMTGKNYQNVTRISLKITLSNGEVQESEVSWLKENDGWKFFSNMTKSDLEVIEVEPGD